MSRKLNSLLFAIVCLVAIGSSAYLLALHHRVERGVTSQSICDINSSFNCSVVNSSEWSEVAGVPVTVPSIALYLMLLIFALRGWSKEDEGLDGVILLGSLLAFATTLVMGGISSFLVGAWCLFCMALYACSIAALALASFRGGGFNANLRAGLSSVSSIPAGSGGAALGLFVVVFSVTQMGYIISLQAGGGPGASSGVKPPAEPVFDPVAFKEEWRARPVAQLTIGEDDAVTGPADAPVTVIEYADYECPFCQRFHPEMKQVLAGYGDKVRFIFRHYPLDQTCNTKMRRQMHPDACAAARAAECGRRQGKFWDLQDLLFDGKGLSERDLVKKAGKAGADKDAFTACLTDPSVADWLIAQVDEARALGLRGTPSIFVEGRTVDPNPKMVAAAIDAALEDAGAN